MSHRVKFKNENDKLQDKELDLRCLDSCQTTYEALSCTVLALEENMGSSEVLSSLSKSLLDSIFDRFEEKAIDLTSFKSFPCDASDTEKCCTLLAQLQNVGYWGSGWDDNDGDNESAGNIIRRTLPSQNMSSCKELMEDALLDRSRRSHRYDIGEWVEVRDASMRWRLAVIENAFDVRGQKLYETSTGDHDLNESEIRWPSGGLRLIFGCGPWLWQQWACLRLEHKLRFEKGHEHDFEVIDINQYTKELWEIWVKDPRNKSFRNLYERVGESGQKELLDNIMAPFDLIDEVVSNSDRKWNFMEDDTISMFTYCSILGVGYIEALIVLIVQLAIPVALFFFYAFSASRSLQEFPLGTRLMLLSVFLYYLTNIARDTIADFINVVGVQDTLASRIRSLRSIVWDNGNDSFFQSLGYSLDLFMNTGYVCMLYILNMLILINIADPFEIIGSVLFFSFLMDLDENIVCTTWFDDGKRFFKAGVVGLILQSTIEQKNTVTKKGFLDDFIRKVMISSPLDEINEFEENVKQQNLPDNKTFLQHLRFKEDEIKLLTLSERVEKLRAETYFKTFSENPTEDKKSRVYFDIAFLSTDSAIFYRHKSFRAWSQWEKMIFCCPTPSNVPENYKAGTRLILDKDFDKELSRKQKNISPSFSSETKAQARPTLKNAKSLWRRVNDGAYRQTSESRTGILTQIIKVFMFFFISLPPKFLTQKGYTVTRFFYYFTNLAACVLQILFPMVALAAIPIVLLNPCLVNFQVLVDKTNNEVCQFETLPGWNIGI
mmetsp:Transcript_25110/g.27667  ORF Transcript_25110/g.27667 Transcript_25110/m.27667 type:complete len:775 (+) Transcript_25110:170-2494(+)|eukprot:CAMPEP_0194156684 /NCGR_PEP_ID=MMETSP0152-20130528/69149_1 /TAXON_ID=1049557 /ORGANISM="Thalassiothrix antarctica, Strain L6-D1" /LENGTH=774 /DNA_ID=CAMNT_0038864541 /DNA_START=161 /DNA_END=2485 /DNA_ORIENTATION=-